MFNHVVPMDQTTIKTLYIFVEIGIDSIHLTQTIRLNFPNTRDQFQLLGLQQEVEAPGALSHIALESSGAKVDPSDCSSKSEVFLTRLALVSTIQFVATLQRLKEDLSTEAQNISAQIPTALILEQDANIDAITSPESLKESVYHTGKYDAIIPRSKPLSPGEVLGCTAPRLGDVDALM